jgi:phosphopantetheinyl transferase (holo-ACP synthase)
VRFSVIGNDVVDLADPAIAGHHENERFLTRVCSEDERRRVVTARDLWSLFAAKEAAYKALVKLGGSPGFGHRAIRVAADLGSVTWRDVRLALRVTGDRDHVHAVAWSEDAEGAAPLARVVRIEDSRQGEGASEGQSGGASEGQSGGASGGQGESEGASESDLARAVLCDLLATALGCAPGELAIVRDPSPGAWDGYGPPRVLRGGEPVDADVSLSHDGAFVAAAALVGVSGRVGP